MNGLVTRPIGHDGHDLRDAPWGSERFERAPPAGPRARRACITRARARRGARRGPPRDAAPRPSRAGRRAAVRVSFVAAMPRCQRPAPMRLTTPTAASRMSGPPGTTPWGTRRVSPAHTAPRPRTTARSTIASTSCRRPQPSGRRPARSTSRSRLTRGMSKWFSKVNAAGWKKRDCDVETHTRPPRAVSTKSRGARIRVGGPERVGARRAPAPSWASPLLR
jgi:hypothetical protein